MLRLKKCRRVCHKASYTLEAAIYIPIILFLLFHTLEFAIEQLEMRKERVGDMELYHMDIVGEFYIYQIMEEVGKEIVDD